MLPALDSAQVAGERQREVAHADDRAFRTVGLLHVDEQRHDAADDAGDLHRPGPSIRSTSATMVASAGLLMYPMVVQSSMIASTRAGSPRVAA